MRPTDHSAPALPLDDWHVREQRHSAADAALNETLFALANGFIGTRGTFEEGGAHCEGTYLNGVYVKAPIVYEESAYGFATHNDKMIPVPNGKAMQLFADGEALEPAPIQRPARSGAGIFPHAYTRAIDFRTGVLTRQVSYQTAAGTLTVEWQRLASFEEQHVLAIQCHITSQDFRGELLAESLLDADYGAQTAQDAYDPRAGHLSIHTALQLEQAQTGEHATHMLHRVRGGEFMVATACDHRAAGWHAAGLIEEDNRLGQRFLAELAPGQSLVLTKFVAYHAGTPADVTVLRNRCHETLERAAVAGFSYYMERQVEHLQRFWEHADVAISGDAAMQQGMRFNLFHLFQSVGRDGQRNIGAKGITGPGYDGHYFWDTEIYMLPLFAHTAPGIARALLAHRYSLLDASRRRARQMGHASGALYAWRTISGDECSAYFPAGSAQYHINAAIAYATRYYLEATGDWEFIWEMGAEMLLETARIWMELGHFNPQRGGQFTIHGVTGPDEYTAIVDNNFYTNAMARQHLRTAAMVAKTMQTERPAEFGALSARIGLEADEIAGWRQAADQMYLPVDDALGVNPQDDTFLSKPRWDFESTPARQYPLLLHFHPLVIYRHQVLKQADVVLAMVLLSDTFSDEQKARNYDYYEPLTTHDSTLSSCIYSIAAAELGHEDAAYRMFEDSARMDIDNHHNNTHYGIHTACMAGSWACVVRGFAGMRMSEGALSFAPYLPEQWQGYQFHLGFRGRRLKVEVSGQDVRYTLLDGEALEIGHAEHTLQLEPGKPTTAALIARRKAA